MLFRRNVFILGAGFTADAGAPVMKDFLSRARNLLDDPNSGLYPADREAFGKIFDFLRKLRAAQAKITLDLENIEHLFGLAEMDLEFGAGNPASFRRDLIFLILRTLERTMRTDIARGAWSVVIRDESTQARRGGGVESNYGEFFAALASRRWLAGDYGIPETGICQDTIITMNYDCFLDDTLIRLGVKPDYAITNSTCRDEYAKQFPFRMAVLKLHGSANWIRCPSDFCNGKICISGGEPAARLNYYHGHTCPGCGSKDREPVIVPPTWAKSTYNELLAPVWKQALDALQKAGRIFIIGYSMPAADAFFQYMLALALTTNEELDQVVVVNPDPHAQRQFWDLFQPHFRDRRFAFEQMSTAAYVTTTVRFGEALGQHQQGVSSELINESGFTVR